MLKWYLVLTKLKSELRVKEYLWHRHGLESFFPVFPPRKHQSKTGIPLFSRYIFTHCNLNRDYQKIQYAPGVTHLVRFGETIVPVAEDVIVCLKARCDERDRILPRDFEVGQQVVVREGIFRGCEGIISEKRGKRRIQLLIQVAYQHSKIELDVDQVLEKR